jgi:site-specific recombinase XerD
MITFKEGLQAYRIYARAAGHSPATISWIEQSIRYFSECVGENRDITQITANDLRQFIITWGERARYTHHPNRAKEKTLLSPLTVLTYTRGVRAFFSHLAEDEVIPHNPMQKVKLPKVPTRVVPTHSQEEAERLLRAPDRRTPTGFRDFCWILTFFDCEIRLSELCNLDEKDVDLEAGCMRVMGKGAKERLVPIGAKLCRALLKYKLRYRFTPIGCEAFWVSEAGERLKPNRIQFLLRKYGRQVGLERCHPHKLRHTGSVFYLRNGGDPFSLQKILGHSSLQMTRHYCNLADTDVKKQHQKFGVGDHLKT